MKRLLSMLFILSLISAASAEQDAAERMKKVADRLSKSINEQDYSGAGRDFAQTMEDFFPLEKRTPFFKNLTTQYGKINKLDEPRLTGQDQALFVAHCDHGKLDITIWLNEKDKITGLLFLPHKPDLPVPQRSKTELSLPFKGKWLVVWGGDTKELNQHHDTPNQRFAFDFLGVDE